MALSTHGKGILITASGVLIFTPDALLVRLTAIDAFSLAVGRGLLGGIVVLVCCAFFFPGNVLQQFRALGRSGLALAFLQAVAAILFLLSLELTSVANVLIFFATAPLIAAAMAWVFLRERVSRVTLLAMLLCLIGLAVVVSGSLGSGHLLGDMLALANACTVAAFYVVIRRRRDANMIPALGLGMLLGAAIAAPFAGYPAMLPMQWLWLLIGSAVVFPVALMLLTLGPRYLPAPEVAMLTLLETVLGPYWVWLVLGENPGLRSILGGGLIVLVLLGHALIRLRRDPGSA